MSHLDLDRGSGERVAGGRPPVSHPLLFRPVLSPFVCCSPAAHLPKLSSLLTSPQDGQIDHPSPPQDLEPHAVSSAALRRLDPEATTPPPPPAILDEGWVLVGAGKACFLVLVMDTHLRSAATEQKWSAVVNETSWAGSGFKWGPRSPGSLSRPPPPLSS